MLRPTLTTSSMVCLYYKDNTALLSVIRGWDERLRYMQFIVSVRTGYLLHMDGGTAHDVTKFSVPMRNYISAARGSSNQ